MAAELKDSEREKEFAGGRGRRRGRDRGLREGSPVLSLRVGKPRRGHSPAPGRRPDEHCHERIQIVEKHEPRDRSGGEAERHHRRRLRSFSVQRGCLHAFQGVEDHVRPNGRRGQLTAVSRGQSGRVSAVGDHVGRRHFPRDGEDQREDARTAHDPRVLRVNEEQACRVPRHHEVVPTEPLGEWCGLLVFCKVVWVLLTCSKCSRLISRLAIILSPVSRRSWRLQCTPQ